MMTQVVPPLLLMIVNEELSQEVHPHPSLAQSRHPICFLDSCLPRQEWISVLFALFLSCQNPTFPLLRPYRTEDNSKTRNDFKYRWCCLLKSKVERVHSFNPDFRKPHQCLPFGQKQLCGWEEILSYQLSEQLWLKDCYFPFIWHQILIFIFIFDKGWCFSPRVIKQMKMVWFLQHCNWQISSYNTPISNDFLLLVGGGPNGDLYIEWKMG
jgi:hypothetical protein